MSNAARQMRMPMAALAGSLALTLSLVSAPAVLAQDDGPEATVMGLMEAIEAKDFERLPTFFCAEFADEMGGLDLASMTEDLPPGVDVETLLDAFILDVEVASIEVLSQTDTEAVVSLGGTLSMDINAEALGPFIEAILLASDMEVTEDMVDMFTGMMISQFEAESTDIDTEITLVPGEAMPWLVCSDLSAGIDGGDDTTPDETAPPIEASPEATTTDAGESE